ncbi:hypothetical protein [Corynebacterium sp. ES2715-CONJ3]|uniref:hypothetical protein n=1 Tax=Corynebacterium sp. ES2715-CONJ3 TaxID=2974028 RepID=UPI002166F846|nr:hypothetical protein [Corynebacterium sp. ES2715-CONJ3]MCS4491541.1 hypothetical protein [Corynebacterium sp. ES2715-CONJ3]
MSWWCRGAVVDTRRWLVTGALEGPAGGRSCNDLTDSAVIDAVMIVVRVHEPPLGTCMEARRWTASPVA